MPSLASTLDKEVAPSHMNIITDHTMDLITKYYYVRVGTTNL